MIFYFSGTGNSLFAAKTIAEAQEDVLKSIPEELDAGALSYEFKEGELLGFVYPVHAWGPPSIVLDFIRRMKLTGKKPYVFSLCTCGNEEGHATKILEKALAGKGLSLDSAFTLQMPNNYIVMFDLDQEDWARQKLEEAPSRLSEINEVLKNRRSGVMGLFPGQKPALKSSVVNPLFVRFARKTKKFYATEACTGCGLCAEVCPIHTITVRDKPVWGKDCLHCMACIHRCPEQAIQYGEATLKRGRYHLP